MYAVYDNIRSLRLSRFRETARCSCVFLEKSEVSSVSLIHYEDLSPFMNLLRYFLYIAAYSIVIRRWKYNSVCIGIIIHAPYDFFCSYFPQNSAAFRFFGVRIYRLNGCQPQSVEDGLVAVSGHNQLASRSDTRQNSCDKPSRAAVYQKV